MRGVCLSLARTIVVAGGALALSASADSPQTHPPTERVIGPRAEVVRPDRVEPGHSYQLDITGKNFIIGMTISFGDLQPIGPPYIVSPTKAILEIIVPPTAPLGVRPAAAMSSEGSNTGPGGILVWVDAPPAPSPEGTPTPAPKKGKKRSPTPTPEPSPEPSPVPSPVPTPGG